MAVLLKRGHVQDVRNGGDSSRTTMNRSLAESSQVRNHQNLVNHHFFLGGGLVFAIVSIICYFSYCLLLSEFHW